MPEPQPEQPGVSSAVQSVAERLSNLARLETELASREFRRKMRSRLIAVFLVITSAVLLGFAVAAALAAIAAGFATFVDPWLAILILVGILVGASAAFLIPALIIFRRAEAPTPDQALEEARATAQVLTRSAAEQRSD